MLGRRFLSDASALRFLDLYSPFVVGMSDAR